MYAGDFFEAHVVDDATSQECRGRYARGFFHSIAAPFSRAISERDQLPVLAVLEELARFLLLRCGFWHRFRPWRSGLIRSDTTLTTRDASKTCIVLPSYAGAIFTAVCALAGGRAADEKRIVLMPRRCISEAT